METIKPNARRDFLIAASLGGAAAAAVAATANIATNAAAATATESAQKSGYRATPHILAYYKTTEF